MNLNELQTFLAVVETANLSRAAERLNVTQSTVSARLNALEAELGQRLLNRNKYGVSLTGAGERLRRTATTITDLWHQARQETALPGRLDAVCNIGCHPDLWPALGERFFTYLRQRQPGVALSVWHGGEHDLDHWLRGGLVDIAFTWQPRRVRGGTLLPLDPDELILVADRPDRPVRFDPGYVFVEHGETFGRDHAAAYADAGMARISFGSAELAVAHILAHGGSAYLHRRIIRPQLDAGVLHRLAGAPGFRRQGHVVIRDDAATDWTWLPAALGAAGLQPGAPPA